MYINVRIPPDKTIHKFRALRVTPPGHITEAEKFSI